MAILVPMTEADFDAYVETSVPAYAAEKVRSGQWASDVALNLARSSLSELLPQGIATPGHHLFAICCGAKGATVGMLWFAAIERGAEQVAYVYDVLICPEHRRKGYAAAAFEALEAEVRARGLAGIALHVFGHNAGARALYEKLGYLPTNISMIKHLPPHAQSAAPEV